jgi:hypothetical protein
MTPPPEPRPARVVLSFQTRLNLTLLAAAVIPLAIFGGLLLAFGAVDPEIGERLLLFMFAISIATFKQPCASFPSGTIRPSGISAAISRLGRDMSQPIPVVGDDVLAQLAESHNRLAADAERRIDSSG